MVWEYMLVAIMFHQLYKDIRQRATRLGRLTRIWKNISSTRLTELSM